MRKFLLALPLASLLALAGCTTDDGMGSAATLSSPDSGRAAAVTQAPAQQQQQPVMQTRHSTTQPLPAGYGYLNEKELGATTPIRPAATPARPAAPAPAAAAPKPAPTPAPAAAPAQTPARNG